MTKDGTQFIESLDLKGTVLVGFSAGGGEAARCMLRKTVLPVIAISLCVLLLLAVSACSGATQAQPTAGMATVAIFSGWK